eukprot:4729460-Prymnesium_polylepis.1
MHPSRFQFQDSRFGGARRWGGSQGADSRFQFPQECLGVGKAVWLGKGADSRFQIPEACPRERVEKVRVENIFKSTDSQRGAQDSFSREGNERADYFGNSDTETMNGTDVRSE